MKKYGLNELREMYLSFFESKGHLRLPSFSLIPQNDKSLLLINAGMAPLKPYFTGAEIPPCRRVTTCQKCIRTGDIENVGKTARHGTFFEMLGNFSFGDYFKQEAIAWSWEFLTQVVGLAPDRLYPSVYQDDDEAFAIWNEEVGIPKERIFRFGKEDNFWEHGAGPCGPCSEIYYDRGEAYGCGKPDCTVGCDCDRYIEVWNNVFTQFENDGNGHYETLKTKNIDTGMGLERLAVVVQDVDSIFDVDTIRQLRDAVCTVAGKAYHESEKDDISIRLITDHIRSATFMISDGIMPTNEGRGYVLRRLIRRAARHGRLLGITHTFLAGLSETVIESSKTGYPELAEKRDFIVKVLTNEENQFNKTVDQGLSILAEMEKTLHENGSRELSGTDAFKLYDTYGFPMDLTREIAAEKGYTVDEDGFKAEMEKQRVRARTAREVTNYMGADATVYDAIAPSVTSVFDGYDTLCHDAAVTVLTTENELTDMLSEGQRGTLLADRTPFYATMGGQEGDCGTIVGPNGTFRVEDTIKLRGGRIGHVGVMTAGLISVGETVTLTVDAEARLATCRNHSATHLLQKALKEVLGGHVEQKGSLVTPDRLRFDFSHFQAMTAAELEEVERRVNEAIERDLPVVTQEMSLEEAKKAGAMALFGEKYADTVRVVSMGDYSKELCGGTHVAHTGVITLFKILSEGGVAAGVRRIEALTGQNVTAYYRRMEMVYQRVAHTLKVAPGEVEEKLQHLLEEQKALRGEIEELKSKQAAGRLESLLAGKQDVGGIGVVTAVVPQADSAALRALCDACRDQNGTEPLAMVLAGVQNGTVSLAAFCSKAAIGKGANAGKLVKATAQLCGGNGGGRPDFAMAGGKEPEKADAALATVPETLRMLLG